MFDVLSPSAQELRKQLASLVTLHAEPLGAPRVRDVSVVEFPTAADNWLSFVSSGLIVFSDGAIEHFERDDPRGVEIVAHELAHLWFGVSLRAEGPAARWLTESFAEYYAWRALARARGDAAVAPFVTAATEEAAAHPTPLRDLGFADELVYTRGALGVRALATAVGRRRGSIGAIRQLVAEPPAVERRDPVRRAARCRGETPRWFGSACIAQSGASDRGDQGAYIGVAATRLARAIAGRGAQRASSASSGLTNWPV